jgi:alkylation response protein AidB-like acyl-CoA dehydrogenase
MPSGRCGVRRAIPMDFRLSPQEEAFRREIRAWLAANLPAGWGTPAFTPPHTMEEKIAFAKAWQRTLHDGGWAGLSWPAEHGGRGATLVEQLIFSEEYAAARAPDLINIGVGPALAGPTIIHCGTAEQKRRFLRPILTGEEIWCQGFSEPGAGSDLAACRTRAEFRGDDACITGQKIWTSYAKFADWCILLARTNPEAPKHKGLTFFLVDMKSPGITIRPLVEMTGVAWFNEVFFDDVRVPRSLIVGAVDTGWQVAITTLMHERGGSSPHTRMRRDLEQVIELAKGVSYAGRPAAADPRIRQRLAQHYIEIEALKYTAYRHVSTLARGGQPGPEGSIFKLLWSELDMRIKETAIAVEGPYAAITSGSPHAIEDGKWQYEYLWSRAASIYAGTSEIQRNIIAQRVLGLPRE